MSKTAIVNSKDLFDPEKNPTLCLSAKRYTCSCAGCNAFQMARTKIKKINGKNIRVRVDIDTALKSLKCKPNIPKEVLKDLRLQDELIDEKLCICQKIKDIDDKYSVVRWWNNPY